ncbi:MAG: DUF4221 family protein [Algoriphagus sp.]|uniref:DUF4221 family protein n=1 Tax=Algoriphagus sp. TaxID=1872435 RepID=UPI00272EEF3E|nr:DUF4221 family protein [Algoriphagus sp.]MDP2042901.1 DUF4221 family protein [Algoriphagus sp.]MDP3473856.1 DUF4221 family protein [Algoriphagus sp.]
MKKFTYLLFLPLIFACGGNSSENPKSENVLENLTFSVDTVVIDSGADFFNLNYGLGSRRLTNDKGSLMFFENEPLTLVHVDLNQLKLISKTPFQNEGPNGVGSYVEAFQLGPNSELFIQSYTTLGKFNMAGELTENLKIVPQGINQELANDFRKLYSRPVFDFNTNRIYSQPSSETSSENVLYLVDLLTKEVKSLPIPEMKSVGEFSGIYITKSGEQTMFRHFNVDSYQRIENGHLFLSAGAMSGIYRLDPESDSLEFIDIQHKSFPNRMTIKVNNSPSDEATFLEDRKKVSEQLNYMEPLWDETREMYLRLGKKTFLGKEKGDPSTYEVFLFAYDKDFNVLGETKIEGLKQVPANYFWKNGKLWSYVNVADELGFAVIDFKF